MNKEIDPPWDSRGWELELTRLLNTHMVPTSIPPSTLRTLLQSYNANTEDECRFEKYHVLATFARSLDLTDNSYDNGRSPTMIWRGHSSLGPPPEHLIDDVLPAVRGDPGAVERERERPSHDLWWEGMRGAVVGAGCQMLLSVGPVVCGDADEEVMKPWGEAVSNVGLVAFWSACIWVFVALCKDHADLNRGVWARWTIYLVRISYVGFSIVFGTMLYYPIEFYTSYKVAATTLLLVYFIILALMLEWTRDEILLMVRITPSHYKWHTRAKPRWFNEQEGPFKWQDNPLVDEHRDVISDELMCGFTQEYVVDPVRSIRTGHLYERGQVYKWLDIHHNDPTTGDPAVESDFVDSRIAKGHAARIRRMLDVGVISNEICLGPVGIAANRDIPLRDVRSVGWDL